MSGAMAAMVGSSSRPTVSGLVRRSYVGYAGGNVNWFATRTPFQTLPVTSISLSVGESDSQGAEWIGYWFAPTTGNYSFQYSANTYSYLWIGNEAKSGFSSSNAILNPSVLAATRSLIGGVFYPMRVQWSFNQTGSSFLFFDNFDSGFINFFYSGPGIPSTQNLAGRVFYNPGSQGF